MNENKCNCGCNVSTADNFFDTQNLSFLVLCSCKATQNQSQNEDSEPNSLNQKETFKFE